MSTVASVVTHLRANTGQFDASLKRAKQTVTGFASEVKAEIARISSSPSMNIFQKADQIDGLKSMLADVENEQKRFAEKTEFNMRQAVMGLARYERFASTALPRSNAVASMSFKELNNSLKATFGRGSDFKEFIELVSGAGAIAGIGLVAAAVGRMGTAFRQANEDIYTGAKLWQQSLGDFARSIPILGTVGGAIADVGLSLSPQNGGASAAERAWWQRNASKENARFFDLVQARQARERMQGPAGQINESARQQLAELRNLSNAGGIGPRQFEMETAKVIAERDRLLKAMEPNKLAGRIADLFQTKSNTIRHSLGSIQKDVEVFNAATDSRLQAATDRWADRLQTKINTLNHWFKGMVKQQDAFNDGRKKRLDDDKANLDAAESRRDSFIGGARGFLERLQEIESAPVQFAGATQAGSQQEFAARQQALFGNATERRDQKKLMEEAVKLQRNADEKLKEVNGNLRDIARNLKVADFN